MHLIDLKDTLAEAVIGKFNVAGIEIHVDDHALNRCVQRMVLPSDVDRLLKKLPNQIEKIRALPDGHKFWIYDADQNISLGMRKYPNDSLHLKSVLDDKPWTSDAIVLSVNETLQAIPTAEDFSPAPIYYFAYGMLTDPRIMPGAEFIGPAVLKNHLLEFRGYANVRPGPGKVVGALWNIDRRLLAELDQAEGYPRLYDRKTFPVICQGERYEAMVYTMTPESRDRLDNRKPSRGYIDRLVKGYNHADIPLTQISQALERRLDEISMNPRSFAQSIKSAGEQGVLVGYEFEVCVPQETIKSAKELPVSDITPERVREVINNSDGVDLDITSSDKRFFNFLKVFKFKNASVPYTDIKSITQAMMEANLPELVKAYYKTPEEHRKKRSRFILQTIQDRNDYNRLSPLARQYQFAYDFGRSVYLAYRGAKEKTGSDLMKLADSVRDLSDVLAWALNVEPGEVEGDFLEYFTFDDARAAYEYLELDSVENPYDWDYDAPDEEYVQAATKVLQPAVQSTFNQKTIVFMHYHEKKKNLNDWYIEPDGSINVKTTGDAGAEIVSPPLPASNALQALNSFFNMANQLNLYTNNSTGLHINVSIPKDLDVLKLAVLLGEDYVLKYFGRENNRYARSVMQQLTSDSPLKKGFVNAQKQIPILDKLLARISRAHTASINNTGKYISFRHVGGNYLADPKATTLSVARFIQAMVIAADPNAYRNEYLAKLTKLFPAQQATEPKRGSQQSKMLSLIAKIKSQGWPAVQRDLVFLKTKSRQAIPYIENLNQVAGDEATRQKLLQTVQLDKNKLAVQQAPQENLLRITALAPSPDVDLSTWGGFSFGQAAAVRGNKPLLYTDTIVYIPASDPVVQQKIMQIAKPFVQKKLQQKQKAMKSQQADALSESLYYKGYPCTVDCSGHMAGYVWAQIKGIQRVEECPLGHSNSFYEGCKSYAEGR
jgi:gamma-glutamylcyclotransferase (GGCT)/AIG2-like uncharacterized protein YtfP